MKYARNMLHLFIWLILIVSFPVRANESITLDVSEGYIKITDTGYMISKDYYFENVEEIPFDGDYVLTGQSAYCVRVIGGSHNITLNNIDVECYGDDAPISVRGGKVALTIIGENYLTDKQSNGAFELKEDAELIITEASTGNLKLYSSNSTGIGSSYDGKCGDITINGGTLEIDAYVSGIGSGAYGGSCGDITINNGNITITSQSSVGMGNGTYKAGWNETIPGGRCGNITINNGVIVIKSESVSIGNAGDKGVCGNITINGGRVSAEASSGCGIGSTSGNCGDIIINNGIVETTGIGVVMGASLMRVSCGDIIINGGKVTSVHDYRAIGPGTWGKSGDIIINGGNITAIATGDPEDPRLVGIAIGAYGDAECGNIILNGGQIKAVAPEGYEAIGAMNDLKYTGMVGICKSVQTGKNGNAIIQSTSINQGIYKNANGIIIEGNKGIVYGIVELVEDYIIPEEVNLKFSSGAKLVVKSGTTLKNEGTFIYNKSNIILEEGAIFLPGELIGDVNKDNFVDTSDSQAIFNHFMGVGILEKEDALNAADVNGDGVIDTSDAQMAFNMFMGVL